MGRGVQPSNVLRQHVTLVLRRVIPRHCWAIPILFGTWVAAWVDSGLYRVAGALSRRSAASICVWRLLDAQRKGIRRDEWPSANEPLDF